MELREYANGPAAGGIANGGEVAEINTSYSSPTLRIEWPVSGGTRTAVPGPPSTHVIARFCDPNWPGARSRWETWPPRWFRGLVSRVCICMGDSRCGVMGGLRINNSCNFAG